MTIGIYGIFDTRNGDCLYIGQSKNIQDRWRSHRKRLLAGKHLKDFTEWFKEQGSDISTLELRELEETINTDEAKNAAEIRWFDNLSPKFYGQVPSANKRGWEQAEETKQKISTSVKQRFRSSGNLGKDREYTCAYCGLLFKGSTYKVQQYCSVVCRGYSQHSLTKEDRAAAKELLKTKSLREVAKIFNTSTPVMHRIRHS